MTDTPHPGLRERKKRATRTALAEAAVRLAAEHGAEHVTVEAISQAAGVSPRTFFNYFDSRDDAFVMLDAEVGERVRRAVLEAPAALSPLEAVRDALAAELADLEERHELWHLRGQVLHRSPHLLARSLGAHMTDERGLAAAVAERLGAPPRPRTDGAPRADGGGCSAPDAPADLALYPRVVAAMAATAVRVAVQHWSENQDTGPFPEVFRRVFEQLGAGLSAPAS
ncbi:TetR family transcriptional regulator [Streptomyces sp. TRM 70351]|uniref:TetR/AcrR family transcriptional regulator n=1 Tax=Streptomyces sp. TRM 70351 TaxID=3116552 RepID=UPI002E7B1917|nr:TetR family transcriptional regulator [Streptomyces sp. TRM 70351]MEE1927443.1 TetR family transcriptional regulator [Streptomyces sp. TRM 70351]